MPTGARRSGPSLCPITSGPRHASGPHRPKPPAWAEGHEDRTELPPGAPQIAASQLAHNKRMHQEESVGKVVRQPGLPFAEMGNPNGRVGQHHEGVPIRQFGSSSPAAGRAFQIGLRPTKRSKPLARFPSHQCFQSRLHEGGLLLNPRELPCAIEQAVVDDQSGSHMHH